MRFGQSAADADTLTRARPLATSTESVSCHTEENLGVEQWYKSMSRSPPATAVHVRENFLAAGPHASMHELFCLAPRAESGQCFSMNDAF